MFTKSCLKCLRNFFSNVYEISSRMFMKSLLECLWNLSTGIKRHKACPSIRPTRVPTFDYPPNCVSKSHTTLSTWNLINKRRGTKEWSCWFKKENLLKFKSQFSGDLDDGARPKVQGKGQRAILTIERNLREILTIERNLISEMQKYNAHYWEKSGTILNFQANPFNSKPFAGSAP